MTWVRLEPRAVHHPKFRAAGWEAWGWFTAAVCYANDHETDGFIPALDYGYVLPGIPGPTLDRIIESLTTARLVHPVKTGQVARCHHPRERKCHTRKSTADGLWLHDFLDYQPTADEVREKRRARSAAGRKGGETTWKNRQANAEAVALPLAQAVAKANRQHLLKPVRSGPVRSEKKEPVTTEQLLIPPAARPKRSENFVPSDRRNGHPEVTPDDVHRHVAAHPGVTPTAAYVALVRARQP